MAARPQEAGKKIILSDPIHGSIEIDSKLMTIIDTPEFQRLRNIKQLGGACYVYPGAVHTRFEHSIGVCYIAGELVKKLQQDHPDLINDRDVLCVQIAALCHDLGHGPFSHVYDDFLKRVFEDNEQERDNPLLQHEYRSAKLLEELIKTNKLEKELDLRDTDCKFIKEMITFDKKCESVGEEKLLQDWTKTAMGRKRKKVFLFEIVANGFTGIDVDKMDYFARDSHGCGLHNKFGWRRYIQSTRLVPCKMDGFPDPVYRICTRDKDEHNLCELFHVRYVLYRAVYKHKTTLIIQHKIQKALMEAKDSIKFRTASGDYVGIHECALHMEAFTLLTDSIQDLIMLSPYWCGNPEEQTEVDGPKPPAIKIEPSSGLDKAREILGDVQKRKFPRCIGRKLYKEKDFRSMSCSKEQKFQAFQDGIKKEFKGKAVERRILTEDEAKNLTFLPQKFASKEREKIKQHFFYGKYHGKEEPGFQLTEDQMSDLLPESSVQPEVFVYYDFGAHYNRDDAKKMPDKLKELQECLKEVQAKPQQASSCD